MLKQGFYISNLELDRSLPKVIELMKDELDMKVMTEFTALRPKTYSNFERQQQ